MVGLSEILESLSRLTATERSQLKEELAKFETRKDILAHLPPELLGSIVLELELDDLWACLNVSRIWRSIILESHIWLPVCRRNFPGLLEFVAARCEATDGGHEAFLTLRGRAFLEAAHGQFVRHRGLFDSVVSQPPFLELDSGLTLDPPVHLDDPSDLLPANIRQYFEGPYGPKRRKRGLVSPSEAQYFKGRLAWFRNDFPSLTCIFVDDLRANTRTLCTLPANLGGNCVLLALGDELLVARTGNGGLVLWKFREPKRVASIRVPGHITKARTFGEYVVVVTRVGVYRWRLGGDVREIIEIDEISPIHGDLPDEDPTDGGRIVVFIAAHEPDMFDMAFHPFIPGVFYLAALVAGTGDDTGRRFVSVFEFTDGRFTGVARHQLPNSEPCPIQFREANGHGGYLITSWRMNVRNHEHLFSLTFNMITKAWSVTIHGHFNAAGYEDIPRASRYRHHLWADRLTWWLAQSFLEPELSNPDRLERYNLPLLAASPARMKRGNGFSACHHPSPLDRVPVLITDSPPSSTQPLAEAQTEQPTVPPHLRREPNLAAHLLGSMQARFNGQQYPIPARAPPRCGGLVTKPFDVEHYGELVYWLGNCCPEWALEPPGEFHPTPLEDDFLPELFEDGDFLVLVSDVGYTAWEWRKLRGPWWTADVCTHPIGPE